MAQTRAQARAVAHIRSAADQHTDKARQQIQTIVGRAGQSPIALASLAAQLGQQARVTLNFHPDRLLKSGHTVVASLLADGRYKNQFETAITSGSRTAYAGGDRDRWEEALFGGAYQQEGVRRAERPKYGGLNLLDHADGASPRFGSCYFVLRPHMTPWCTFTWGDSHQGPVHVGTLDSFAPLLAAMLECAERQTSTLGVQGLTVAPLVQRLLASRSTPGPAPGQGVNGRALDAYIEAQVHAEISLGSDIEALVIDPAFTETPIGTGLQALAARYGFPLHQHPGFVMNVHQVPSDFRGPAMVPLATRLGTHHARVKDELDAFVVGRAAESLHRCPQDWAELGSDAETWQYIKQLWHVLVSYGRPRQA